MHLLALSSDIGKGMDIYACKKEKYTKLGCIVEVQDEGKFFADPYTKDWNLSDVFTVQPRINLWKGTICYF